MIRKQADDLLEKLKADKSLKSFKWKVVPYKSHYRIVAPASFLLEFHINKMVEFLFMNTRGNVVYEIANNSGRIEWRLW